jgi:glycosyltransferase involved in cell wall biosynthesis
VETQTLIESVGIDSHIATLARLLGGSTVVTTAGDLAAGVDPRAVLVDVLSQPNERAVWLVLAVLQGETPTSDAVVRWRRRIELEGATHVLATLSRGSGQKVRIIHGGVVVDAHHTLGTTLSTGIQRVARNVLSRWHATQRYSLVAWDRKFERILLMPPGSHAGARVSAPVDLVSVVPWESTYILPELAVEAHRLERVQAIAEFSASRSAVIGFDTVPMTSAETCGPGMPGAFARNLAALTHFDRIAAISDASATEYEGWRTMIHSAGLLGPEILSIGLPLVAIPTSVKVIDPRKTLGLDSRPIVMCLGSHEPRKNHPAVLHAAELLWREGLEFQVVFCGGNGWGSEGFEHRVGELRSGGRKVSTHTRVPDATVSALMREARFSIFPSLSEGYGLPVAESLASGTPVITANYGSMAGIASHGGALVVNPRDDSDIADAMRKLLQDDELVERLAAEAAAVPTTTWEAYADELWSFFVN